MKIITDSSCDLPQEIITKWDIDVIPLQIEIDGQLYTDGENLSHEEFYEKMAASPTLPKTSQPTPKRFMDTFSEALKQHGEVLSIHLSSKLSGTYEGAQMIKKELPGNIEIFDTLNGSIAVGLMVMKACEMVQEGLQFSTMIEKLTEYRDQMRVVVYLESLENAVKGGRVSRPKEMVANLLNLKPVVHVEDGYVRVLKNIRGKKKAMRKLLEEMEIKGVDYRDRIVAITHCDCLEDALELKEQVMEKFSPGEILLTTMGPVIGTHAGKGGLLICF